jgi:hypothetical protein
MLKKLRNKIRQRQGLWISVFIAFIMIFSAFGVMFYGFTDSGTNLKYGDYSFTATQSGFFVKVAGKQYLFSHFAGDVSSINLTAGSTEYLKSTKMVYLTYYPNQSAVQEIAAAEFQVQKDLSEFGIYGAPAFTVQNDYGLPVISCRNATVYVPVIEFKESNVTEIAASKYCLVLSAAYSDDFSKLRDRLLYSMLGIIK